MSGSILGGAVLFLVGTCIGSGGSREVKHVGNIDKTTLREGIWPHVTMGVRVLNEIEQSF